MKSYPLEEKVSGEIRDKINQLYQKKKFGRLADFLREKNLWDQAHRSIFLEKVLLEAPQQTIRFLQDWTFSPGDYYNITRYGIPYVYEETLKILDEEQRKDLAHIMGDAVASMCDFHQKLSLLLNYQACDRAFWDIMILHGREVFFGGKCFEEWNVFEECLKQITEFGETQDEAVATEFRTAVLALGDSEMQNRMAEKMSETDWYALYLSIFDKDRSEVHRNYLTLLLEKSPAAAEEILSEWQYYTEDFEIISGQANADCYCRIMQALNHEQRQMLAKNFQYIVPSKDAEKKLYIILEYEAYSSAFWDKILNIRDHSDVLLDALEWLSDHQKDGKSSEQIKLLETKIIENGSWQQLEIFLPYLSEDGWMKLTLEQFKYAILSLCPPHRVIFNCMSDERNGYWQEIVKKISLKDEILERIFWPKHFLAFKTYISYQKLNPLWERMIYSGNGSGYKKHRKEYQRLYKLPLYKRILYWLK